MPLAVVLYPSIASDLLGRIRRAHDPSVHAIAPHVTVLFPIPETGQSLTQHVARAAKQIQPFEISFDGFHTAPDHWLFLRLGRGADQCRQLHTALYAGDFAQYRRTDIEYVPHLALGLFLRARVWYDARSPNADDRDVVRYDRVLGQARPLLDLPATTVTSLHLIEIPSSLMAWFDGGGGSYPEGEVVENVGEVTLGTPTG